MSLVRQISCSCDSQCKQTPASCDPLAGLFLGRGGHPDCVKLLWKMLDLMPIGVWVLDKTGAVIHCNPAGENIIAAGQLKFQTLTGEGSCRAWWRDTGAEVLAEEWAAKRALNHGEVSLGREIKIECFDGSHRFLLNSAVPVLDEDNKVLAVLVINQDVSNRVYVEDTLRELAETDMLTGASTRRKFFSLLDHEIERHVRYARSLSAILLDTDHFKRVNDNHGHLVGDEVLTRLGRLLASNVRKSDHFCRLGGEEFVILLPETETAEAVALAEKLRSLIEREEMPEVGCVTCSLGVSQYLTGEAASTFLRRLDETMYLAKKRGRNQVAFQ